MSSSSPPHQFPSLRSLVFLSLPFLLPHPIMTRPLLLFLVISSLLATAFASHNAVRDPREHMYLAAGAQPSKRYIGKRGTSKNGLEYPEAGTNPPNKVPDAWMQKYKSVKAAGLIPDLPVPKLDTAGGLPVYPAGTPDSKPCNWEVSQCYLTDSIRFAPEGTAVVTLDDGPTPAVDLLVPTLQKYNLSATHFLIGSQIIWCPECLQKLVDAQPQQHFGSHSFTHVQLATFTDEQVVADLGWSTQLIYDYTGFVPLYWRAPQGDVDIRVSAIAKHVFGLQHVFWTHDATDWCVLDDGSTYPDSAECKGITPTSLSATYKQWAGVTPQNGMIPLAHELRKSEVQPLTAFFDELIAKKWKLGPVPVLGLPWYSNAAKEGDKPTDGATILPASKPFEVTEMGHKIDLGGWAPGIGGDTGASGNSSSSTGKGGSSGGSSGTSGTSSGTSGASSSSSTSQQPNNGNTGSPSSTTAGGTTSTSTTGTSSSSAAGNSDALSWASWTTIGATASSALVWLFVL